MVVVDEEVVDTVAVIVVVEVVVVAIDVVEFIVVVISFGWVVFTLFVVAPSTVVATEKKHCMYSTSAFISRS